ncbi:MAG TPA: glycosyltransferase, partial [Flavobacteriia bacterium]|nr:glycosyltransferase [Flavobacteriia bacterium]
KQEAQKLKHYEQILHKANFILSISPYEYAYFKKKFGEKVVYVPVFHKNNEVKKLSKNGKFALYHGDLRVADNIKACLFLINVFKKLEYPLIVASSYTNKEISSKIKNHTNITFDNLSNENQLDKLFNEAHINVLPTFQKTGIKLKLIHALFQSRFCLVNEAMVKDTGLENLCQVANGIDAFRDKITTYSQKKFTDTDFSIRKEGLKQFNNILNAKKIVTLLNSKN